MIEGKSVIALIPARGGSKGLPRKNVLPVADYPLVAWPIMAAKNSQYIDRIICSTDDEEIAAAAIEAGADVPFLRPSELAADTASSIDVVLHALDSMEESGQVFDYIVLLEPTSPLTESHDIDNGLLSLFSKRDLADSIVGVSKVESTHPDYDVRISSQGLISPYVVTDFKELKRRQEIEPLFFLDGSFYISEVIAFRKYLSFYHERTLASIMPRWKSFEIDEFVDLVCVEAILSRRSEFVNNQ